MSNYINYYQRVISQGKNGLKLVLGGTGLGKTSSIKDVIQQSENLNRKCIYMANRIQLLEEMKEDLPSNLYTHQRNNEDIVLDIISNNIKSLEHLLQSDIIKNYCQYLCLVNKKTTSLEDVAKNIASLQQYAKMTSNFLKNDELGAIIREKVSKILGFFKPIIRLASEVRENNRPAETVQNRTFVQNMVPTDYTNLTKEILIQKMFPYIEFKENPEKRIFLVTIQKAFFGFFDGKCSINLENLKNEGNNKNGDNIIFLDEFDFLESELIYLLAKDVEIAEPFEFVKNFYTAMRLHKLTYPNFLETSEKHRAWKVQIEKVLRDIENLNTNYNINYPNIYHFICNEDTTFIEQRVKELEKEISKLERKENSNNIKEIDKRKYDLIKIKSNKIKGKAIFQTRYSISSSNIYVQEIAERPNSFNITPNEQEHNTATAFALLNVVKNAVSEIIRIFKEINFEEPSLYASLERYCFNTNDSFRKVLKTVRQYPMKRKKTDTNYDKLQYNGFGLYEIEDLEDEYDPFEIKIKYYAIFSTPEKILYQLSKNNIVFGLSATASIQRIIKNFDTRWLEKELKNNYFNLDDLDESDIKNANQVKENERKKGRNEEEPIKVYKATELDITDNFYKELNNLIDKWANAEANKDYFGGDRSKHKRNRVKNFFATLSWILENRTKEVIAEDTHLLFFSSYRQIEWVFNNKQDGGEKGCFKIDLVKKDNIEGNIFTYYTINFKEQTFNIIFYNAEKSKDIYAKNLSENYYKMFLDGFPVILITTYNSAGNGVNLQYFDKTALINTKNKPNKDFKNVHLLDSQYYFFEKYEKEKQISERNASIKINMYRLAKLLNKPDFLGNYNDVKKDFNKEKNGITKGKFKDFLSNIRNISNTFNSTYIAMPDGVLGQLAIFIQALGRIERVWKPMEQQNIRMISDVYNIFEKVSTQDIYYSIFEYIKKYFSTNLVELFIQVRDYYEKNIGEIEEYRQEDLPKHEERSKNKIQDLVRRLESVRQNSQNAQEYREEWKNLRDSVLKHKFNADILTNCIFSTAYYDCINECLHIDNNKNIVLKELANSTYERWNVNSIYDVVKASDIIRNYFELHDFPMGFDNNGMYFTPYTYQAILLGAIGEEAIKAFFSDKRINIPLSEDDIPNELFELVDLRVKNTNFYIDAKNFSEMTLMNFGLEEGDAGYHNKMNEEHFKTSAVKKLKQIQQYHQTQEVKIIYLFAFGKEDRPRGYFDIINDEWIDTKFDFQKAKIITIFGMIDKQEPNKILPNFEKLLRHLNPVIFI